MRMAEDCERQAQLLDRLAEDEPAAVRRQAYRQMAAFWRTSAKERSKYRQA